MKRTSVVELIVDKEAENRLKLLCSLSSKLWNEVNYARRRMFFEARGVDLKLQRVLRKIQSISINRLSHRAANLKQRSLEELFRLAEAQEKRRAAAIHNKS